MPRAIVKIPAFSGLSGTGSFAEGPSERERRPRSGKTLIVPSLVVKPIANLR